MSPRATEARATKARVTKARVTKARAAKSTAATSGTAELPSHWARLAESLDRLADRVLAGEVVFFIGAGFSLDSEGNSTWRLLGRLLARFEGITEVLGAAGLSVLKGAGEEGWSGDRIERGARELRAALRTTFELQDADKKVLGPGAELTSKHLEKLVPQYYAFNDWVTSAYGQLAAAGAACQRSRRLAASIHQRENEILRELNASDTAPLATSDLERAFAPRGSMGPAARGKLLFLETLGFGDEKVMGGRPLDADLAVAEQSFRGKLLPRHHVLARLAREGFCPSLLTTNYDLLLEGAYRMAGFSEEGIGDPEAECPPFSLASYPKLVRVGEARHFFERTRGSRAAQVIKIHGCADRFRQLSREGAGVLEAYLPSVVFTFREIQNWREDSWSRDLVSTLLRTKTLVFSGYSAADPVLHDTFRTVYEEMELRWAGAGTRASRPSEEPRSGVDAELEAAKSAPCFALGSAAHREFHVLEVLRAASRAMGVADPPLHDHPNYLPFYFLPREGGRGKSPTLDQAMLWMHHRVQRRAQRTHAERELSSVLPGLLGHPAAAEQIDAFLADFDRVCEAEHRAAAAWGDEDSASFGRIVGWTWSFHPALLRELACSEAAVRRTGPGRHLQKLRRRPWVFPAADRPDWSAWGMVIELAIRRLAAHWRGELDAWPDDTPWLKPGGGRMPDLFVVPGGADRPAPIELSIRLAGRGRRTRRRAAGRAVLRRRLWALPPGHLPWPRDPFHATPSAAQLWRWACGLDLDRAGGELAQWRGLALPLRAEAERARG